MTDETRLVDRTGRLRRARRLRWYLMQIPYFLVLAVLGVSAVLVLFGYWRKGSLVFGAALLLGAALRAVLPAERAGLLQVRSRLVDIVTMASFGLLMLWLASSIAALGTD